MTDPTPADIALCTKALRLIGANDIQNFTDSTREAEVCSSLYETLIADLISSHPWRFCRKQRQLTKRADQPLYGFAYSYNLPPDYIRMVGAEHYGRYEISERKLYSDRDELSINYIFRPDTSTFPPEFVRAVMYELAAELCLSLAEDRTKSADLKQYAQLMLRRARLIDSQNQPPKPARAGNDVFLNVRYL